MRLRQPRARAAVRRGEEARSPTARASNPGFYKTPVAELGSKQYADQRRKLINMDKAARVVEPGLMRKGHSVRFADGPHGGYQAIMVNPQGSWIGASESRKDGQAAAY